MDAVTRATRQRGRRTGGFTLLEIMITLTVVAIGLMAMMMMQVQAMKDGSRGRHRTGAAMIARDQIERIQNMPFSDSALDVMDPLTWTTPPWLDNGSDASLDPGESKSYANADIENFRTIVYPLLTQYCAGCHSSGAPTAQSPYFAESGAVDSYLAAYEAAKSKMDLDDPAESRFVVRLDPEFHNCWTTSCVNDSNMMQARIQQFADTVPLTQLDRGEIEKSEVDRLLELVDAFTREKHR